MALAAREMSVVTGQDHAVGVERKVIIDKKLGVAAEVEKVAVAVKLDDGRVGVLTQQKIVGVQGIRTQPQNVRFLSACMPMQACMYMQNACAVNSCCIILSLPVIFHLSYLCMQSCDYYRLPIGE